MNLKNGSDEEVVLIRNLNFSFDETPVLTNVNLTVTKGQFISVVGPNGGGKTTLLKLIIGLLRPSSGEISVFGTQPERARRRIGYMPQHSESDRQFPVSVMDVVLMGRIGGIGFYSKKDKEASLAALSEVGLSGFEKRSFSALSGGQRQRVLIARALSTHPDLLILDEPTANVDFQVAEEFYSLLHELNEKLTVLLVSHDLSLVSKMIGSVICVNRNVAVHPTSALSADMLNELYGSTMHLVRHDHKI